MSTSSATRPNVRSEPRSGRADASRPQPDDRFGPSCGRAEVQALKAESSQNRTFAPAAADVPLDQSSGATATQSDVGHRTRQPADPRSLLHK
jgi:hypothetical protein